MSASHEELLNIYDGLGKVVGAQPRRAAKASGRAVGAVNALVLNHDGELLMQRRPGNRENGGRWDKSVGGHVSAGESFDDTLVREAGEELFDDGASTRVALLSSEPAYRERLAAGDLGSMVVLRRVDFRLNLRDVRKAREGGVRNVVYHVAIYAGRSEIPIQDFRPQASEVEELRYVPAEEVDAMLLEGRLAPNMAFLWLTQAQALLSELAKAPR
jgi:isopentenyldiphosphate isomerase